LVIKTSLYYDAGSEKHKIKLQYIGRAKYCPRLIKHSKKLTSGTLTNMVENVATVILLNSATKVNMVTRGKASKLHKYNNEDSNRKH
jgi:hypothetical protein